MIMSSNQWYLYCLYIVTSDNHWYVMLLNFLLQGNKEWSSSADFQQISRRGLVSASWRAGRGRFHSTFSSVLFGQDDHSERNTMLSTLWYVSLLFVTAGYDWCFCSNINLLMVITGYNQLPSGTMMTSFEEAMLVGNWWQFCPVSRRTKAIIRIPMRRQMTPMMVFFCLCWCISGYC